MSDQCRHRGPHPGDHERFAAALLPTLQSATADLSWLFTHGYAAPSAIKLVGDRYSLDARQRLAVARCACGDGQRVRRHEQEVSPAELAHQELWIDGYNVLTSLEAALSDGVVLRARDGCYRDLASMHGSYRKVEETVPAIELLGELISSWNVAACHWLFDQPVSNSGRLKTLIRELAEQRGWNWDIELVLNPDAILKQTTGIVASSDSVILDHAERWFNLARHAIDQRIQAAWVLVLN